MSMSRMLISSTLGSIYNWSPLLTIVFIISESRDNMMIIQGRNVSWNRTTLPRKAKQTGKKNKGILTTFKSLPGKKSLHYLSQVDPAEPMWDEWLNMEIKVLDIPRFVLNLFSFFCPLFSCLMHCP